MMTKKTSFQQPRSLKEALLALKEASGSAVLYAGGTDLGPRWNKKVLPQPESIVDLKGIDELKDLAQRNGEICIGPLISMAEIQGDPVIRTRAWILSEAAGRIACPQIRNRATLGGNLCNASPAADAALPLILMDAVLDIAFLNQGEVGFREVGVADFFHGPGDTALKSHEILAGIRFKPLPEGSFTAWDKFGTRPSMEISVASLGLALRKDQEEVVWARIGYGSVAPVPLRGHEAEKAMLGKALTDETIWRCESAARKEISPITDVRASETYRRDLVGVMLKRMLEGARDA